MTTKDLQFLRLIMVAVVVLEICQVGTFFVNTLINSNMSKKLDRIAAVQNAHINQPVHDDHLCSHHGICGG